MAVFSVLDWPIRVALGVLVAASVGTGAFFLVRTSGDSSQPSAALTTATVAASPTSSPPQATPTALVQPTNEPTQRPATEVPPTVEPTPDTRTPITALPTADQIQLGPDGRYFIADRGDGCRWHEYTRLDDPEIGTEVFLRTDCRTGFALTFRPNSREVLRLVS